MGNGMEIVISVVFFVAPPIVMAHFLHISIGCFPNSVQMVFIDIYCVL